MGSIMGGGELSCMSFPCIQLERSLCYASTSGLTYGSRILKM